MLFHYLCLGAAIALEVTGTMLLPASENFTRPVPTLILLGCYGGAFYALAYAVQALPLALVYATWSGMGVFAVAVLSYLFYQQALAWPAIAGLGMIIAGVILVQMR